MWKVKRSEGVISDPTWLPCVFCHWFLTNFVHAATIPPGSAAASSLFLSSSSCLISSPKSPCPYPGTCLLSGVGSTLWTSVCLKLLLKGKKYIICKTLSPSSFQAAGCHHPHTWHICVTESLKFKSRAKHLVGIRAVLSASTSAGLVPAWSLQPYNSHSSPAGCFCSRRNSTTVPHLSLFKCILQSMIYTVCIIHSIL